MGSLPKSSLVLTRPSEISIRARVIRPMLPLDLARPAEIIVRARAIRPMLPIYLPEPSPARSYIALQWILGSKRSERSV